ncbi:uncharacterized protein [Cherax quadricarinatus]|uniref:uncharacterized protein n=1 Tax=Cherax quadricarinatus TaxID=27406 RepID=UPI0023787B69|nr:uncharacterized protein LOC128696003 [Cherax quadricarinatus]
MTLPISVLSFVLLAVTALVLTINNHNLKKTSDVKTSDAQTLLSERERELKECKALLDRTKILMTQAEEAKIKEEKKNREDMKEAEKFQKIMEAKKMNDTTIATLKKHLEKVQQEEKNLTVKLKAAQNALKNMPKKDVKAA